MTLYGMILYAMISRPYSVFIGFHCLFPFNLHPSGSMIHRHYNALTLQLLLCCVLVITAVFGIHWVSLFVSFQPSSFRIYAP